MESNENYSWLGHMMWLDVSMDETGYLQIQIQHLLGKLDICPFKQFIVGSQAELGITRLTWTSAKILVIITLDSCLLCNQNKPHLFS